MLTWSLTVRKLDTWLLPFLSMMYFFNSVDRSNVANAKTDHMDTDLGFKGNEYRYIKPRLLLLTRHGPSS